MLCLTFFAIVCVGYMAWTFLIQRGNKKFKKEIVDCQNPNCVRCKLYTKVTRTAKMRLKRFMDMKIRESEKLKRLCNSFSVNLNKRRHKSQNPKVFQLHDLPSTSFFDRFSDFQMDVDIITENYSVIFSEFCNILEEFYDPLWNRNDTPQGKWSVFHIINQGKIVEKNARVCPETFSIINSMPSLMCSNVFGNVLFSVIEPQTVISEHHGPTNIRVRCHLGQYDTIIHLHVCHQIQDSSIEI